MFNILKGRYSGSVGQEQSFPIEKALNWNKYYLITGYRFNLDLTFEQFSDESFQNFYNFSLLNALLLWPNSYMLNDHDKILLLRTQLFRNIIP